MPFMVYCNQDLGKEALHEKKHDQVSLWACRSLDPGDRIGSPCDVCASRDYRSHVKLSRHTRSFVGDDLPFVLYWRLFILQKNEQQKDLKKALSPLFPPLRLPPALPDSSGSLHGKRRKLDLRLH